MQSYDMIDATQNLDSYASVSGIVKNCAVNLSKMCNDLRLMSSGPRTGFGEINLPARQNGIFHYARKDQSGYPGGGKPGCV